MFKDLYRFYMKDLSKNEIKKKTGKRNWLKTSGSYKIQCSFGCAFFGQNNEYIFKTWFFFWGCLVKFSNCAFWSNKGDFWCLSNEAPKQKFQILRFGLPLFQKARSIVQECVIFKVKIYLIFSQCFVFKVLG